MMSESESSPAERPRRDRDDEVRLVPILATLFALFVTLAGVMLVLLPWHRARSVAPVPPEAGPALLPNPIRHLARYRAEKSQRLTTYGWVDRDAGIAHIPVERAIEILTRRADAAPEEPKEGRK